jgi:hypothetical protein
VPLKLTTVAPLGWEGEREANRVRATKYDMAAIVVAALNQPVG